MKFKNLWADFLFLQDKNAKNSLFEHHFGLI